MSFKTFLMDRLPNYNKIVLPYHLIRAMLAVRRYGFPGKKMRVIGVTGTNGKTSTCFLIWKMLNNAGYKTGLMTTVAWGVEKLEEQIEHMTTVDAETLNKRVRKIADSGAEFLVLEVTSHALVQYRTYGISFEMAIMTNVTHEHLDYHKTFENYRDAKRKLFKKAEFGIINGDDASCNYFVGDVGKNIIYGIENGDLRAKNLKLEPQGVQYDAVWNNITTTRENAVAGGDDGVLEKGAMRIKTKIPGRFMVYNSLVAVGVGLKLGLTKEQIQKGIYALESIEGRMNRVDEGQNFEVIVDYAHTPDAFLKVFESIGGKEEGGKKRGRIIALFGGAGRRDETTREERGKIAAKNADIVIITEDDSRDEEKEEIAEEFIRGAKKQGMTIGKNLFVELDRKKAIDFAISMAEKDDIVLILGKGHEKTILRAGGAEPFEDLKVARTSLKRLKR